MNIRDALGAERHFQEIHITKYKEEPHRFTIPIQFNLPLKLFEIRGVISLLSNYEMGNILVISLNILIRFARFFEDVYATQHKRKAMRSNILLLVLVFITFNANAKSITEFTPFKYDVLFTNPVCKTYYYDENVVSNDGEKLKSKTKDAYCKSSDSSKSRAQKTSPHRKLKEWIKDSKTKEIFLAYLSFSNGDIQKELCNAIKYRNVKVTLVIDSNNEEDASRMHQARALEKCRPKNTNGEEPNYPEVYTSGNTGGAKYAHNKVFFVNPFDTKEVRIGFSSGNMSSGTTTHHENWHFITTSPKTYFAKAHLCLREGILNHDSSKKEFTRFIASCKKKIDVNEESDIKTFFVPGEGVQAMEAITDSIKKSKMVDMAAHRFSNSKLVKALSSALKTKKTKVRLVADDDIYWSGVYKRGMGRNSLTELGKVRGLERLGMRTKYIETYMDDVFEPKSLQLQHNKFLIFTFKNEGGAVFTGAGNLTSSAFSVNYENFYYISIPEVFKAYQDQYKHFWNELAKSSSDMPTELVLP